MALTPDPFTLLYERIRAVITADPDLSSVVEASNVIATYGAAERETGNIIAISTSGGRWDQRTRKAQATIQIDVSSRNGPLTASQILTHIMKVCTPLALSDGSISVKSFKESPSRNDSAIGYQDKPILSAQFEVFWILPR